MINNFTKQNQEKQSTTDLILFSQPNERNQQDTNQDKILEENQTKQLESNILELLVPSLSEQVFPFMVEESFLADVVYHVIRMQNNSNENKTQKQYLSFSTLKPQKQAYDEKGQFKQRENTSNHQIQKKLRDYCQQFKQTIQQMVENIFPQQNNQLRLTKMHQIIERFYGYNFYLLKYKPQSWGKFCRSEIEHNAVFDIYIKPENRSISKKWLNNEQENYQSQSQSIWSYFAENCKEQIAKFQEMMASLEIYKKKKIFQKMTKYRFQPHILTKYDISEQDLPLQKFIGYIFTLTSIWVKKYVLFLRLLQSSPILQFIYFCLGYKLFSTFVLHMQDSMAYLMHQYDQAYIKQAKLIMNKQLSIPKYSFWTRALTIWQENTKIFISSFLEIRQNNGKIHMGPYFHMLLRKQISSMKNSAVNLTEKTMISFVQLNLEDEFFQKIVGWELQENQKPIWNKIDQQNPNFYVTFPTNYLKTFSEFIIDQGVNQNNVLWTGKSDLNLPQSSSYQYYKQKLLKYNDMILKTTIQKIKQNMKFIQSFLLYRSAIISSYDYIFTENLANQLYGEWDKKWEEQLEQRRMQTGYSIDENSSGSVKQDKLQEFQRNFPRYFTSLYDLLDRVNFELKYLNEAKGIQQKDAFKDQENSQFFSILVDEQKLKKAVSKLFLDQRIQVNSSKKSNAKINNKKSKKNPVSRRRKVIKWHKHKRVLAFINSGSNIKRIIHHPQVKQQKKFKLKSLNKF